MAPSPSASAGAASPSASASASDPTPSWWESVSQARSRILALSSVLPPPAAHDVAALADSDRPARALLRSPAAYAALSDALRSGGGADDPACHWLYDTLLSPDPDLRLAALAFLPLLAALYLRRLPPELPSSLSGFEAVLLAVYSSEAKSRQGKPVLVQVPDLSAPSLYHTPAASAPSSKSPRRPHPPPIPSPAASPVVGVLSPPLEPQAAVKSTKRAGIIGVAFEAYYSKISQMPAASKVDACNAAAAWAGQYCKCRFELDEKELEEEEGDSLGSVSPMSSEAENGKELEEEFTRMNVNGDSSGRNCNEEELKEARVPLPWELLQPVMRVLGHCLLAPLNPTEVRDVAAQAVRVVYARACHDLVPQAILASRSLIELDKSARKAAKAAAAAASGTIVAAGTAGSTASSSRPSSKPNTPSKQRKPDTQLVSK
ncbi:hypothetical protein ACP70R_009089 [Stipagrostis hirtigluma subsp. patula]